MAGADRRRLQALRDELDQIEADLAQLLNEEMSQPGMAATLLPAVRRLVARKNTLAEDYEALNAKCASPDAGQLHSAQETLAGHGYNPTDPATRLRLRSAIRRLVKVMWLLKAGTRYRPRYLVQIDYKGGERRFVWWGYGVGEEASVFDNANLAKKPGLEAFRDDPTVFGFA
jgi:hypothetical protein